MTTTGQLQIRVPDRLRPLIQQIATDEDRPLSSAAVRLIELGLRARHTDASSPDDATWRIRVPLPIRRGVQQAAEAHDVSPATMVRHLLRQALAARGVLASSPADAPAPRPVAAQEARG